MFLKMPVKPKLGKKEFSFFLKKIRIPNIQQQHH